MWQAVLVGQDESTEADDWRRVFAWVTSRKEDVGWNWRELHEATVSEGTLRAMKIDGTPIVNPATRRKLTDGLGWTPNSIDRILAGLEPLLASDMILSEGEDATPDAIERQLTLLAEQQKALRRKLRRLRGSSLRRRPSG